MRCLVLDTSTPAVTTALVDVPGDGPSAPLAVRVTVSPHAHGERLAVQVRECLAESPGPVGAVVAGRGPGPFTGLRVGLVSAAAFADAWAVPAYGVCSLDGIGAALPDEGDLLVVTDARRRELYWARYAHGVRTAGPDVAAPAAVPATATVAGTALYADVLDRPRRPVEFPDPLALAAAAADRVRAGAPTETLVPLYLRAPDAVPPASMTR